VAKILYGSLKRVTETMQFMRGVRTKRLQEQAERSGPQLSSVVPGDLAAALAEAGGGFGGLGGDDDEDEDGDMGLSVADMQMMEAENASLMQELDGNLDQMRHAEAKMHDIVNMLSLFSSKVLEQSETIECIYDEAVESSSHVRMGNQQLRKALDRGVNNRLVTLFALLLASFSLLFLDWYSSR
jgi:syntaxin 18